MVAGGEGMVARGEGMVATPTPGTQPPLLKPPAPPASVRLGPEQLEHPLESPHPSGSFPSAVVPSRAVFFPPGIISSQVGPSVAAQEEQSCVGVCGEEVSHQQMVTPFLEAPKTTAIHPQE